MELPKEEPPCPDPRRAFPDTAGGSEKTTPSAGRIIGISSIGDLLSAPLIGGGGFEKIAFQLQGAARKKARAESSHA